MKKEKSRRKVRKGPLLLVVTSVILLLAIIAAIVGLIFNKWIIIFPDSYTETIVLDYKSNYDAEYEDAIYTGTLFSFYQTPVKVISEGTVDTTQLGTYTITLTAEYKGVVEKREVRVEVKDISPPKINLYYAEDGYTPYNHPYVEEGYQAYDNYDGKLTDQVEVKEENGKVYYRVSDSSGNEQLVIRNIHYDDRVGPTITFASDTNATVYIGEPFDDSFSANDDCDGEISDRVQVEGSVDTSQPGTYHLIYSVSDTHDNQTVVERDITVKYKPLNQSTGAVDNYTIYLTFDDGPGPYTDQLLDILNQYNVKATFFTTNRNPSYAYCIGRAFREGHVVALHTYTHDYAQIYQSTDAYWQDFNMQSDVILAQTGYRTNLFRFPGGSSNTVSANYCDGVVTKLVQQASDKGLIYFDWNVSSGDAGGTESEEGVFNNVIAGIQNQTNAGQASVVLQHDVKSFSVNAVEKIIEWALENGYHFETIGENTPKAHHPIYN